MRLAGPWRRPVRWGNSGLGGYAFGVRNFYCWKGLERVKDGSGRYSDEFGQRKAGYRPAFVMLGAWF